jgi:hypothetical protein
MNQNSLIRMTGQILNKRPQLSDITFNHNDVYAGPIEIERTPTNFLVRVPANCWLIIALPGDDRLKALSAGIQPIDWLEWGSYQAYLVLNLDEKKLTTADGWAVTLSVSISWRVQDPRRITKLLHPSTALLKMCLTAVTTTVQKHLHNDLIGITKPPTVLANALAKEIRDQITMDYRLYGMVIEQVSVCDIRGDGRLVNPQLDACATKSALSTSLETIEIRTQTEQKEALARRQKAEIDRITQIIENQGMIAAKDVEFRRNLALKLASILPELLKNNSQGVGGTAMYAPQSTAIIEATLQRIETLIQQPAITIPETLDSADGYQEIFKLSNIPSID